MIYGDRCGIRRLQRESVTSIVQYRVVFRGGVDLFSRELLSDTREREREPSSESMIAIRLVSFSVLRVEVF